MTATLTTIQKEALQELASRYKVSVAWLIRHAIDRFIEEASGGPKLPFHIG
jgi:predicted transcriptional regulator